MIDLKALSDYQAHLSSRPRALREFNRLDFWTQCEIAARWARGVDLEKDHAEARANGDWNLP